MTNKTPDALDLRPWIEEVRALGELVEVDGADWNLELGAISELNVKRARPPALLFDRIPGYADGFRVMTCSTSSPARLSSLFRLGHHHTHPGLAPALRGKPRPWQTQAPDYEPADAVPGPSFENAATGSVPNADALPSPLWH